MKKNENNVMKYPESLLLLDAAIKFVTLFY